MIILIITIMILWKNYFVVTSFFFPEEKYSESLIRGSWVRFPLGTPKFFSGKKKLVTARVIFWQYSSKLKNFRNNILTTTTTKKNLCVNVKLWKHPYKSGAECPHSCTFSRYQLGRFPVPSWPILIFSSLPTSSKSIFITSIALRSKRDSSFSSTISGVVPWAPKTVMDTLASVPADFTSPV